MGEEKKGDMAVIRRSTAGTITIETSLTARELLFDLLADTLKLLLRAATAGNRTEPCQDCFGEATG